MSHWTWKNRSKVWLKIKSLAKDVLRTVEFFYGMSIHWQSHLLKGTNQRWFNLESGSFDVFLKCCLFQKSSEQLNNYNNTIEFLNWSPFFAGFWPLFVLQSCPNCLQHGDACGKPKCWSRDLQYQRLVAHVSHAQAKQPRLLRPQNPEGLFFCGLKSNKKFET